MAINIPVRPTPALQINNVQKQRKKNNKSTIVESIPAVDYHRAVVFSMFIIHFLVEVEDGCSTVWNLIVWPGRELELGDPQRIL